MLKDIDISVQNKVIMQKRLWSDQELALAKCFWFDINLEASTITADMRMTTKTSITEFLNIAFPRVMTNPIEEGFKNKVLAKIDYDINSMRNEFNATTLKNLGYEDKLYAHQSEALFEMRNKKANLLAFEMGTGKTKTAASISKMFKIKRTLIICPSIVKWNWFNDLTDHITGYGAHTIATDRAYHCR